MADDNYTKFIQSGFVPVFTKGQCGFNINVARKIGFKAAILIQFLVECDKSLEQKFFRVTPAEIYNRTALSRDELISARKKLLEANIIEYKALGLPALRHYRIFPDNLFDLFFNEN